MFPNSLFLGLQLSITHRLLAPCHAGSIAHQLKVTRLYVYQTSMSPKLHLSRLYVSVFLSHKLQVSGFMYPSIPVSQTKYHQGLCIPVFLSLNSMFPGSMYPSLPVSQTSCLHGLLKTAASVFLSSKLHVFRVYVFQSSCLPNSMSPGRPQRS